MAATDAVTNARSLIDFRSVTELGYPFPGIFPTICEEDVRSSNFVSSVVVFSSVDGRELRHIELREYHLAVCQPVVIVDIL